MDVNNRIKQIGKYFAVFNVHDGVVCVGVVFPDKWTLFDIETICNEFHIQIQVKDDTTFFLCDINDGFSPVFDAVDFIIDKNKELEEKTTLLKDKVESLRLLFEQEPLDKLKTLRFVFDEVHVESETPVSLPIDIKKELKNKKISQKNEVHEVNITNSGKEEEIKEKTLETPQRKKRKKNNNDSSLMTFVKDTLDNE